MKSSELRIGNLIGWHDGNREDFLPIEIQGIVGKRIHVNVNGSNQFCHESYQSFTPIPLTEEWLLKFGFEKNYINIMELGVLFLYVSGDEYSFAPSTRDDEEYFNVKIQYVHQLQNLYFALTNEELTI